MTDASDDGAETLDDEVLGDEYPPEHPLGVNERLTPSVEQSGESLGHRVAREDRGDDVELAKVGQLMRPGGDQGADDEADEVAIDLRTPEETAYDAPEERDEVIPAEEAAMHLTDPPPMDDSDGYLED